MRPERVPEPMRVGNAVDEDGRHGAVLPHVATRVNVSEARTVFANRPSLHRLGLTRILSGPPPASL